MKPRGACGISRRLCDENVEILVIDRDDRHVYQPGLLFVPFGLADPAELVRSRRAQLHSGIDFRLGEVDRVETADSIVYLESDEALKYDVLIIATGAELQPEETEGLTGSGWGEKAFTFYSLDGATALRDALRRFDGGRLVVNMIDLPVKCPVAPLEFCFLADWHFHERGVRDRVQITYVTSLDGAFTKETCNRELSGLLRSKGIEVITEFNTGQVDSEAGKLVSWDEREVPFDLLVTIPLHGGAQFVSRSPGLGDDLGFVMVDKETLQSSAAPNVFAIGDACNAPTSKAGSVAHFEGETLVETIRRFLAGEELERSFDGTDSAVERDSEGFFVHPEQWTESMAPQIARENGIDELTDRRWQVVNFMRHAYLENGSAPSIRTLGKVSGVPIKELYQLFPKGPAKLAAKIAGIPKPRGCI